MSSSRAVLPSRGAGVTALRVLLPSCLLTPQGSCHVNALLRGAEASPRDPGRALRAMDDCLGCSGDGAGRFAPSSFGCWAPVGMLSKVRCATAILGGVVRGRHETADVHLVLTLATAMLYLNSSLRLSFPSATNILRINTLQASNIILFLIIALHSYTLISP